jgi:hypothetical protein
VSLLHRLTSGAFTIDSKSDGKFTPDITLYDKQTLSNSMTVMTENVSLS